MDMLGTLNFFYNLYEHVSLLKPQFSRLLFIYTPRLYISFITFMIMWLVLLQAIPSMLLALVLCFDHRKSNNTVNLLDLHSSKGHKYIWYALPGYAMGLVIALAAGVLTHSPQPALLYLVLLFFAIFASRLTN